MVGFSYISLIAPVQSQYVSYVYMYTVINNVTLDHSAFTVKCNVKCNFIILSNASCKGIKLLLLLSSLKISPKKIVMKIVQFYWQVTIIKNSISIMISTTIFMC